MEEPNHKLRPAEADERHDIVKAFCDDCVWTRAIRTQFAELFESGELRHRLLAECASQFFSDLNQILIEHILLQQCKLTDPPDSGKGKDNLTTNYILNLEWTLETKAALSEANIFLMEFREKVVDARRKLVAHTDLKARLSLVSLGSFTKEDETRFWEALQRFASVAYGEAIGGSFELDVPTSGGDAVNLIHRLADAADYDDAIRSENGFLRTRQGKQRYRDV